MYNHVVLIKFLCRYVITLMVKPNSPEVYDGSFVEFDNTIQTV